MKKTQIISQAQIEQLKQFCIDEYCKLNLEYKSVAKQHAQDGAEFDKQHERRADTVRAVALGHLSAHISAINKDINEIVNFYTTKLGGSVKDFPEIIEADYEIINTSSNTSLLDF